MKNVKRVISLCMVMVLLLSSSFLSSGASSGVTELEGDYEFCCDLEETALWKYCSDRLLYATVNGVKYIYMVEDGEATILNVRINYWGTKKYPLLSRKLLADIRLQELVIA
ncbi:MAG: hypothetical protein IIW48_01005 [Clostridia bacterium]|nr:hypothetical protein [Clostridia bacterium]